MTKKITVNQNTITGGVVSTGTANSISTQSTGVISYTCNQFSPNQLMSGYSSFAGANKLSAANFVSTPSKKKVSPNSSVCFSKNQKKFSVIKKIYKECEFLNRNSKYITDFEFDLYLSIIKNYLTIIYSYEQSYENLIDKKLNIKKGKFQFSELKKTIINNSTSEKTLSKERLEKITNMINTF